MKFLRRLLGSGSQGKEARAYSYTEFKFAQDRNKLRRALQSMSAVVKFDGVISTTAGGELLGAYLARQLKVPRMVVDVEQRVTRVMPKLESDAPPHFSDEPRILLGKASLPNGTYVIATGWLPTAKLIKALQRRYANCTIVVAALVIDEALTGHKYLYGRTVDTDVEPVMFWEQWS